MFKNKLQEKDKLLVNSLGDIFAFDNLSHHGNIPQYMSVFACLAQRSVLLVEAHVN